MAADMNDNANATNGAMNDATDSATNGAAAEQAEAEAGRLADASGLDAAMLWFPDWLTDYPWAQSLVAAGVVLLVALLAYVLIRHYLLRLIQLVARRSPTWWDQTLFEQQVFHRLVPLVPMVIIHRGITFVPHLPEQLTVFIQRLTIAVIVLVAVRAVGALLTAINVIYTRYPVSRGRPIKGYLQVVKVLAYIVAGILIVAALMDQSPWFFLSGLGAMTAIILLIFRDTLLSLVAGIQLVNNDQIRVGDWIEMPQFGADGDVVDIALNVVKVRNWDNTATFIPTHKFLEHSFKNWRNMHELGGRRIKRAIHIDMSTIRFLTDEEIERFSRFLVLKDYMGEKREELAEYNRERCPEEFAGIAANQRHLTNVGTFRAYVSKYLWDHPNVHKQMTFLIRQLEPGQHGLPIEVYVYINDTRWPKYEGIQADIFDHILAVVPEFGLRVFQEPTGYDMQHLSKGGKEGKGM